MTTTRSLPSASLPFWPRQLTHAMAAAYVGVSPRLFDHEIARGVWPKGEIRGDRGGVLTWDRVLLDAVSDRLSGLPAEKTAESDSMLALIRERFRNDGKTTGNRAKASQKNTG